MATWLPLALLSFAEWLVTGRPSRLLTDLAIEARFLVTVPLLFVAERALHVRTRRCIGSFANLMFARGLSASSFVPSGVLFLAAALVLTVGPLTLFSGPLQRARFAAIEQYGILALDYTRAFQRRWIGARDEEKPLGTPDIQSLADRPRQLLRHRARDEDRPCRSALHRHHRSGRIRPDCPTLLIEVPLPELARRLMLLFFKGIGG